MTIDKTNSVHRIAPRGRGKMIGSKRMIGSKLILSSPVSGLVVS